MCCFFFFKQKTAYEMRISDWSSDVCSSDLIEKAGVVPLAWGENGYRQLSNSKRDVKMPEDLKGMKLRVVGSPLYIDTFTALGANPTQMSWADAQPALATGAVDGQENPLSIYAGAKMYDVAQKYLTLWNYVRSEERRVGKAWVSPCRFRW